MAQSDTRSTAEQEVAGPILRFDHIFPLDKIFPPTADSSRASVGGWRKDGRLVLVNHLEGLIKFRNEILLRAMKTFIRRKVGHTT